MKFRTSPAWPPLSVTVAVMRFVLSGSLVVSVGKIATAGPSSVNVTVPATPPVLGASLTAVTETSRVAAAEVAALASVTLKEIFRVAVFGASPAVRKVTERRTVSYCASVAVPVSTSEPLAPGVTVMPNWAVAARVSLPASRPALNATVAPLRFAESTSSTTSPPSTVTAGPFSV